MNNKMNEFISIFSIICCLFFLTGVMIRYSENIIITGKLTAERTSFIFQKIVMSSGVKIIPAEGAPVTVTNSINVKINE